MDTYWEIMMEQTREIIICPYCKQEIKPDADIDTSKPLKCYKCGKEFKVRMEYEIIYITTMMEEPEYPKKF